MLDLMGHPSRLPPPRPAPDNADDAYDTLLDYADPGKDARVLLVGSNNLELMCALIRRGCLGVCSCRSVDRPETASADIALVPHAAASIEYIDQMLAQVRRALVPSGRLVVRLPVSAPATLLRHVNRGLRLHGFSAARTRLFADQVLLRAELSLRGGMTAMACV